MRYPSFALTLSVLESLFGNPGICAEFPFIGYAKRIWSGNGSTRKSGCRGCGNRPGREYRQHVLETVKAGLIGMPPDRIKRFKDLVNADKIILHFAVRGQTITKEL